MMNFRVAPTVNHIQQRRKIIHAVGWLVAYLPITTWMRFGFALLVVMYYLNSKYKIILYLTYLFNLVLVDFDRVGANLNRCGENLFPTLVDILVGEAFKLSILITICVLFLELFLKLFLGLLF